MSPEMKKILSVIYLLSKRSVPGDDRKLRQNLQFLKLHNRGSVKKGKIDNWAVFFRLLNKIYRAKRKHVFNQGIKAFKLYPKQLKNLMISGFEPMILRLGKGGITK